MPETENIKWEIKDGKCKCEVKSKCSMVIKEMWELDKQSLGEWVADALHDKGGAAYMKAGGLMEYEMGQEFKNFQYTGDAIDFIKKRLGDKITEMQLFDAFCEAAIGLKEVWDEK